MRTLFLLALLFALFLKPAAASSPILNSALPAAPMSYYYPDPDGLLDFCNLCQVSFNSCPCSKLNLPYPSSMLPEAEPWERDVLLCLSQSLLDAHPNPTFEEPQQPAPGEAYTYHPQPLQTHHLQQLNQNATTVMPSTVRAFLGDTYNPLDRLESLSSKGPPHQQPRRQPRRPNGGFLCEIDDCGKAYNRNCDLNRHQKTHSDDSQRPHKCSICAKGFLYPKDVARHEKTHDGSASPHSQLRCPVPGCTSTSFGRRDNLLRHLRNKHPYFLG